MRPLGAVSLIMGKILGLKFPLTPKPLNGTAEIWPLPDKDRPPQFWFWSTLWFQEKWKIKKAKTEPSRPVLNLTIPEE